MSKNSFSLKYKTISLGRCNPGTDLTDAIREALDLSIKEQCEVSFQHNDTTYTILPKHREMFYKTIMKITDDAAG